VSAPFLDLDGGLRAHIEGVGAILVGTRDASLRPEITRGWGAHILSDCHTIDLCISLSNGAKTLLNLRDHDEVAVTFCNITTYKTVQLKGRFTESGEPTQEDWQWIKRHRKELSAQAQINGVDIEIGARLFAEDLVRIRLVVQQAFEQTPGPGAGGKL
jgi:hypothetical protein